MEPVTNTFLSFLISKTFAELVSPLLVGSILNRKFVDISPVTGIYFPYSLYTLLFCTLSSHFQKRDVYMVPPTISFGKEASSTPRSVIDAYIIALATFQTTLCHLTSLKRGLFTNCIEHCIDYSEISTRENAISLPRIERFHFLLSFYLYYYHLESVRESMTGQYKETMQRKVTLEFAYHILEISHENYSTTFFLLK